MGVPDEPDRLEPESVRRGCVRLRAGLTAAAAGIAVVAAAVSPVWGRRPGLLRG